MIRITIILLVAILTGCKDKSPEIKYAYTVWVGSSVVASGYDTNEYTEENGMIIFVDKRSKKQIVPKCNVMHIEAN